MTSHVDLNGCRGTLTELIPSKLGMLFSKTKVQAGLPLIFVVTGQQDQLAVHFTGPSAFILVHNSHRDIFQP